MALKKVLRPGDVVTRNRSKDIIAGGTASAIRFYRARRRNHEEGNTGTVLDLVTKKDRNGRPIEYANVLWGGRATPSLHAVTRLDLKVDSE